MAEREDLLAELVERARYYATLTTLGVPPTARASAPPAGHPVASAPPQAPTAIPATGPDRAALLQAVRDELGECQRCRLAGGRKSIVFGQGNPEARLMFVGEAPGADEDEQGLAFVGRAGQLLTKIIEAIGMRREDVYIANVIKCRPPGNRNPETEEILACQPFLERQIAAIQPKLIVALGKFSAQLLLKTATPITKLRGCLGEYQGVRVMPTYHPAYLLRNPAGKKDVWEDMKVVRDLLAE